MKPAIRKLNIPITKSGFYTGNNRLVAIPAKLIIGALILWAVIFREQASKTLNDLNGFILTNFAAWYIWVMALFVVFSFALLLWPAAGRLILGADTDKPEFSNFSWISMMFGAGIGVGMMTWSVAEPLYHFQNSPETIMGQAVPGSADNALNAFKWVYLNWGLSAWACYSICGLALGYFAHRRGLPLTIRSSLASLFGKRLEGGLGHIIDVVAVVATVLGVAQTLGFGVEQFVSGMHRIGLGDWLLNGAGKPTAAAILFAVLVIVGASTFSAISGVGKGIKWLSNLNMVLSIFLLGFFLIFGASWFGVSMFGAGILEYLRNLPVMLVNIWSPDGTATGDSLAGWQGSWTVFTFAWWIAFAPFVGLFLARISKGRTIRSYICGSVFAPTLIAISWFAFAGGTSVDLELSGTAQGAIVAASDGAKMFATVDMLLAAAPAFLSWGMAVIIVVLLITYLVTSADSAILVVNTVNAGGSKAPKARRHIVFWGVTIGGVVSVLLLIGGLTAVKTAMVIGALPFSLVMVLMCASLGKAIYRDTRRDAASASQTD